MGFNSGFKGLSSLPNFSVMTEKNHENLTQADILIENGTRDFFNL